ncbi:sensor histidine kinase [Alloalcanivorax xenomutans]|uniref:histidine kinase n=1 Tax=Alloalcanivorax xenomutans TaxID=1094342 RepID=A0A9Q3W5J5_9GAMM|nr:sensor histidine kinase [Alloalcanivorax xenomutans]ERS13724.1 ATPase [Alcanivorax sp. PN-3]MBA4721943.1 sensor histidine kinase [Alcanivorax sp.]ARB45174.1 ATPase [Alloalcanivorax xenomutans]MCE7510920.1 sensor histidine kinase [Alloalcanivorax xenomutans]MCE7525909.1 sensor histidine kinase [Alloalcanivorax xenomutans]
MTSIAGRLGVSLFVSLLLAGILVGQGALWWLDQRQRQVMTASLRDEAVSVLAAISQGPSGLQLEQPMLDPAYRQPFSGRYFMVSFDDHIWRSRSLWDQRMADTESRGLDNELVPGPDGQQLLRYRGDYEIYGHKVAIVVAQDYTPQLENFRNTRSVSLLAWVLILSGLAAAQLWLIRRGLRPLNEARRQIEQLRDGERTELDCDVPTELRPLVQEVNRLLGHTDQQLRRSRHAIGDLGHALKTPLAVLRNRCDEDLRREHPDLYRLLDEQLAQVEDTVRRALNRARVAAGATPGTLFHPDQDLVALRDTMIQVYGDGRRIELMGTELPPQPVERDDMLEVLGNLMDNACKWARGRVSVRLWREPEALWLSVEDDGPGIEPARRDQVIRRGERLDQRVAGHGLGLAIVSDTAEAYGGELTLGHSEALGGLMARVCWPLTRR